MIEQVARALFVPILLVAAGLLVKGYQESGGGFAAGVVASLGVLLQYLALGYERAQRALPWTGTTHRIALCGLAVMAATLLAPVLWGLPPAWHLPRPGEHVVHLGALGLHTTFLFELGIALATFGFVVAAVHRLARSDEDERPQERAR